MISKKQAIAVELNGVTHSIGWEEYAGYIFISMVDLELAVPGISNLLHGINDKSPESTFIIGQLVLCYQMATCIDSVSPDSIYPDYKRLDIVCDAVSNYEFEF